MTRGKPLCNVAEIVFGYFSALTKHIAQDELKTKHCEPFFAPMMFFIATVLY